MEDGEKILIVDDETDTCYFLSRNLSKRNFSISCVHTLGDASAAIHNEHPALILLDNKLPDGWGIDRIRSIKEKYPDIKIIMITAHDTPIEREKALNNGADYFLAKPFSIIEMNKAIDKLISQ